MVEILAEMVAAVWRVDVEPGARVAEGDTLLVLESMKMELPVFAPLDGVVAEVRVREGDRVHEGDVLVVIQ